MASTKSLDLFEALGLGRFDEHGFGRDIGQGKVNGGRMDAVVDQPLGDVGCGDPVRLFFVAMPRIPFRAWVVHFLGGRSGDRVLPRYNWHSRRPFHWCGACLLRRAFWHRPMRV